MNGAPHDTPHAPISGPRRWFLRISTALASLGAVLLLAVPAVGYVAGRRRREAPWVPVGSVDAFPLNETLVVHFDNPLRQPWDGMAAATGVFVRNQGGERGQQFLVMAVNCAHLGCPVTWFSQSGLFMCPCHGGVYYADGSHASGPPPRGLFHCTWRVREGQLEVQAPHYPTLQNTLRDTEDVG